MVNETTQEILEDIFQSDNSKDKNGYDVLNELFSGKGIKTRTDLSIKEIIIINKKYAIANLLQWKSLKFVLDDYMMLKISKNRLGRSEFVDAFKAERANEIGTNKGLPFQGIRDMFK